MITQENHQSKRPKKITHLLSLVWFLAIAFGVASSLFERVEFDFDELTEAMRAAASGPRVTLVVVIVAFAIAAAIAKRTGPTRRL